MRDMDGPRRIDVGFQDSLPVLAVRRVSLELACPPTATPMTPLASAESTLSPFGMLADVVANAQGVTVSRFAAV
jgi:hypothetical protein